MKRICFLILLMILACRLFPQTGSSAQRGRPAQPEQKGEVARTFTLMHFTGAFEQKEHTNAIVAKMGELTGVNPPRSFTATFDYTERTTFENVGDHYRGKLLIRTTGFVNLKKAGGFDLSHLLIPDRMSFRVQLLDGSSNVVFDQSFVGVDVSAFSTQRTEVEVAAFDIPSESYTQNITWRVTEIISPAAHLKFFHSEQRKNAFMAFAGSIPGYARDAGRLNTAIAAIRRFDLNNLDHLQSYMTELEGTKTVVEEIRAADYQGKLNLASQDPASLVKNLETYATLYQEAKRTLQELLRTLDDVYYQGGMGFMQRKDYRNAMTWFQKALDFNRSHVPSNYQVAIIDFRQGRLPDARDRAYRILSDMHPDKPMVTEIRSLLNDIHETEIQPMVKQAGTLLLRGDFQGTEKVVERIVDYYRQFPGTHQGPSMRNLLQQFQTAVFLAGESQLRKKSYTQALDLLGYCLSISQKYGIQALPELPRLYDEARSGVFSTLLFSGQQAMNIRDFTAAEFYLNEAIRFWQGEHPPASAHTALEVFKKNLFDAYLAEGKKHMAFGDFETAITFFDRAQQAQYTYGIRGYEQVPRLIITAREGIAARMLDQVQKMVDRKNFTEALQGLRDAEIYIRDYGLGGGSYEKLYAVTIGFYHDILLQVDVLNRNRSYQAALEMIGDARFVCRNFPVQCDLTQVEMRERDARKGIYLDIVTEAEKSLAMGDLGQAKLLVSQASSYQQSWQGYIPSDQESKAVGGKIRHREYQNAITNGSAFLGRKEYPRALAAFDEAYLLEKEGGFTFDKKLPENRTEAAYQTILLEADKLNRMLEESSYMATKDKLLQLMTMRMKYNLQENKEIGAKLQSIQLRMVSAACRQQQEIYDAHISNAYGHARERNFILASDEIGKAIAAARALQECDLSDSTATRYLVQLTPAILYQRKLTEAHDFLKAYRNNEALDAYLKAEEMFHQGNVHVYGLSHEPVMEFARKQNLNFMLALAYHYKDQGALKESMQMLKELAAKGYPADQTQLLQEQIGYQNGMSDSRSNPASKWSIAVVEYTGGQGWFKYFRKAYKKGWKAGTK